MWMKLADKNTPTIDKTNIEFGNWQIWSEMTGSRYETFNTHALSMRIYVQPIKGEKIKPLLKYGLEQNERILIKAWRFMKISGLQNLNHFILNDCFGNIAIHD